MSNDMPDKSSVLLSLLGAQHSAWMMWPSERFALLGILQLVKPERSLELGCAEGGLTTWLSQYSTSVVTVDSDPKVLQVTKQMKNVTPLCMKTTEAFDWIQTHNLTFDLTVIDADHSREGVRRDLERSLAFSHCILLHDTYYPPCRAGMMDVLLDSQVYFDLELIPGGLQPDGMWGGLGIVLPRVRHKEKSGVTPRRSTFHALASEWKTRERIRLLSMLPRIVRSEVGALLRRVRSRTL